MYKTFKPSSVIKIVTSTLLVLLLLLASCDTSINEPHEEEEPAVERSYTKTIDRSFDNAFEESLLYEAEAIYPPRDSVLAAAPSWFRDSIPPTKYWWYWHFDGVLLPYAITGDAVAYYSALIDTLEARAQSFLITAELDYRAEVSFESSYTVEGGPAPFYPVEQETFERVYVVSMHLDWNQYCGFTCAMSFNAKRVVLFDEQGILLKVFFDTKHAAFVS